MMKRCVVSLCFLAVIAVGLYAEEASAQEYSNQPGYKEARELIASGQRLYLRRAGVSPSKAKKAIWALSHKPESSCALLVGNILQTYSGPGLPSGKPNELGEGSAMSIEDSDICEPRNLDKYTPKPAPLPFHDENNDPHYQAKIFFRDHEQEARQILADAGISPQAIDNVVKLYAEDPKFKDTDYQDSVCALGALAIVFKVKGYSGFHGSVDSLIAEMQSPEMCDSPDPNDMH